MAKRQIDRDKVHVAIRRMDHEYCAGDSAYAWEKGGNVILSFGCDEDNKFRVRIETIREVHARKPSFLQRLGNAGL